MRLFNGLKIRGKLVASFGLAMVLVLSALGMVTYMTFADSVLTSQARIAALQAQLAGRVVDDAIPVVEHDLRSHACPASAADCSVDLVPGNPTLARDILALGLPESAGVFLSTRAGQWLVLKPGVVDSAGLRAAFLTSADQAERAALAQTEPALVHAADHYLLSTRLARPDWRLHYAVPDGLYQTDLVALKNRVIAATVVVLWVSVWIVLIIAQRLALPVRNLSTVMSTADQSIDGPPRPMLARGDEIGELARAFDALAARVRSLIHIDPLTQLFNRRYATQVLDERLSEAIHRQRSLVCLILDVDFFKSVNDQFGHPCGDQALIHCAGVIRGGLREGEMMARHGGEEFMVILANGDLQDGIERADQCRRRLEEAPLHWQGQAIQLTISVGVGWITPAVREATARSQARGMAQLIEEADQALYEAKRQGRNRTLVWDPALDRYRVVSQPAREAAPASLLRTRAGREADQRVERAEA